MKLHPVSRQQKQLVESCPFDFAGPKIEFARYCFLVCPCSISPSLPGSHFWVYPQLCWHLVMPELLLQASGYGFRHKMFRVLVLRKLPSSHNSIAELHKLFEVWFTQVYLLMSAKVRFIVFPELFQLNFEVSVVVLFRDREYFQNGLDFLSLIGLVDQPTVSHCANWIAGDWGKPMK